ncbi:SET domain-containing protein [Trametes coccinea BRFM310]|uniref:SET domain-containing protein n=1 Tax=Trametes coccinea (strain BRFM310) TaxID=1353009 RepID=A0A1Y2IX37_TRAC3|nr:SET domain-containing protein [Trametes coccinea BRFM310]
MDPRMRSHPMRPPLRPASGTHRHSRSSVCIVHTPSLEPIATADEEEEEDETICESSDSPRTSPSPTHGQESSGSSTDDSLPPYKIALAPLTDGVGLFATRAIPRGAVVLSEAPVFTQPPPPGRTNSTVMAALSQCTRDEQRQYFNLANAHKAPRQGKRELLPALGIFETNALPCGKGRGGRRAGVFLLAARLNHSCQPNVARSWDECAQRMTFRALRDIGEGEELCMNYVDVLGTRAQRMEELRTAFGFECACEACALVGEELLASDRRRAAVRRLFEEVAVCGSEPTLGLRKVKLALRLLKEENLVHYEASFCFDAFQFCILVSDYVNAKLWVRKAWEASCNTSGPDSPASRAFKMYWANPRAHELAGVLPQATLHGPD